MSVRREKGRTVFHQHWTDGFGRWHVKISPLLLPERGSRPVSYETMQEMTKRARQIIKYELMERVPRGTKIPLTSIAVEVYDMDRAVTGLLQWVEFVEVDTPEQRRNGR